MFTKVERLISSRNLRPKKKEGFLKIISVFSFLGIMLGVAILIIVMSVMNGFKTELTNKILGLNPHIVIQSNGFNIDEKYISKIKNNFKNFQSPKGRGRKYYVNRYKKKFKLIDESYNSNPLSANVAINKISLIKKEKFKKYLILGDMLELGSRSKKYHIELFKVINNSDIDKVFIKGKETIFAYKHLNKEKRGNILQHIEDIDSSLSKMISNNDYLMIKGSNATGLNDFSKKMIKGK